MGFSLRMFSKYGTLKKMDKVMLANMPKEVILACVAHEIAYVWEKLPKHLQDDIDIMKHRYCYEHHHHDQNSESDVNDGPIPRKSMCCICNIEDVNIGINKNDTYYNTTPSKKCKLSQMCCCCVQ
ncbi:hypothetical protein GO639_09800 [Staphylococcus aureus]|nr:hypothetical protein [Staphylococcus aureus]